MMSETDQCQRCGRYLYGARERATAEERDALRAEIAEANRRAEHWRDKAHTLRAENERMRGAIHEALRLLGMDRPVNPSDVLRDAERWRYVKKQRFVDEAAIDAALRSGEG